MKFKSNLSLVDDMLSSSQTDLDVNDLPKEKIAAMKKQDVTDKQLVTLSNLKVSKAAIAKMNCYTASVEIQDRIWSQPMTAAQREALINKFNVPASKIPSDATYGDFKLFVKAVFAKK